MPAAHDTTGSAGRATPLLLVLASAAAALLLGLALLAHHEGDESPAQVASVLAPPEPGARDGVLTSAPPVVPPALRESLELRPAAVPQPARDANETWRRGRARNQPYVARRWDPAEAGEGAACELLVVDGADRPVAAARVEVLTLSTVERGALAIVLDLLTDEHGRCLVPAQGQAPLLRVSLAGTGCSGVLQLTTYATRAGAPRLLVVPLQPEFQATGRVLYANGSPAPGVLVTVQAPQYAAASSHVPPALTSDATGRFHFEAHLGDGLIVRAEDGDLLSDWLGSREMFEQRDGLVLRLPGSKRLLGVVLDGDGIPVPRATIVFLPDDGADAMLDPDARRMAGGGVRLQTDAQGRFELALRLPGSGVLWSLSPACELDEPLHVTVPPELDRVEVVLRPRFIPPAEREALHIISGRVMDAEGRPMPRAVLSAAWTPAADSRLAALRDDSLKLVSTAADDDGRFVLRGLMPHQLYSVMAQSPRAGREGSADDAADGAADGTADGTADDAVDGTADEPAASASALPPEWERVLLHDVPAGMTDLTIVVSDEDRRDAAIELLVVDAATSQPVTEFNVLLLPLLSERLTGSLTSRGIRDAAGRFRQDGLQASARHEFAIGAAGFAPEHLEGVAPQRDARPVTVRLQRTGSLHATLVGDGGPVAGAFVEAEALGAPASSWITGTRTSARTDTDGVLRLDDLRPGRWLLSCEHDGRTSRTTVDVASGATTEANFTLR